jgi:Holliday junction resolvase RusA-like endonuclease
MVTIEAFKSRGYEFLVELLIIGQPPSKSNRRKIARAGRGKNARPILIKSPEARQYVKDFLSQVPDQVKLNLGNIDESLMVVYIVWYRSRRSDLSVELIKDALQAAEVIANDRYIQEEHLYGFVDKENPRTHILIFRIPSELRTPPFE